MRHIIFIVLASLALASCTIKLDLQKDIVDDSPGEDASYWMTSIPDDTPVARLSIPGAHDAASVTIASWPAWTRTQDLDIAGLWKCGVRAFDLRPAWVDGTMGIFHDKYSASVTLPEILDALGSALDRHPGEAAIIIIRHEGEADGGTEQWAHAMGSILPHYRQRLAPWTSGSTLGDIRGKILLLSRDRYSGGPFGGYLEGWSSSDDIHSQKNGSVRGEDGQTYPLWVQDYYHPNGAADKWEQVEGMLAAAASAAEPWPLVVNHTSGYLGTLPDYRSNARNVNERAAVRIRSLAKPTGIVMMDFAGVDKSKGKDVGGATLVRAVIENNR